MAAARATSMAEKTDEPKRSKSIGSLIYLPKHSYWFDFVAFVILNIVFFLFVYFIVP